MLCSPVTAANSSEEMVEATMLIRAKRFFHFFTQASSGGGDAARPKAFTMAAFTSMPPGHGPENLKCDFNLYTDQGFFAVPEGVAATGVEAAPWCVQLKSISSKVSHRRHALPPPSPSPFHPC